MAAGRGGADRTGRSAAAAAATGPGHPRPGVRAAHRRAGPATAAPGGLRCAGERAGARNIQGWAGTIGLAIAEVLGGDRPVAQLLYWTSADVFAQLTRRAALAAARAPRVRDPLARPTLRNVRVSHPANGVAEVCTVIHAPGRARALAFRLEVRRGRWLCTVLELG